MATPPTDTAMPASSAPAQDTTAAAPAPAPASDPKAIIASEFPTYDKDSSGALSRAEFDTWLVALKEKSGDTAMKPADKTTWLKTAFTTADKDKNKGVSLTELTDYLTAAS
jgi:Ca2+-binding EF-hand superfamily protein